MKRLALLLIGLALIGLANPVSGVGSGYVLHIRNSTLSHFFETLNANLIGYDLRNGPLMLSCDMTIRNWPSSGSKNNTIMGVSLLLNDWDSGATEIRVLPNGSLEAIFPDDSYEIIPTTCNITKEWCRVSVEINETEIKWCVNGKCVSRNKDTYGYTYNITYLYGVYVESGNYDLYVDNVKEWHGDNLVAMDTFDDSYFRTGTKYLILASQVGSHGHSFDIPPAVILLTLALAILALRKE